MSTVPFPTANLKTICTLPCAFCIVKIYLGKDRGNSCDILCMSRLLGFLRIVLNKMVLLLPSSLYYNPQCWKPGNILQFHFKGIGWNLGSSKVNSKWKLPWTWNGTRFLSWAKNKSCFTWTLIFESAFFLVIFQNASALCVLSKHPELFHRFFLTLGAEKGYWSVLC